MAALRRARIRRVVVVLRAERGQDLALGRADERERRDGAVLEAPERAGKGGYGIDLKTDFCVDG